MEKTTHRQTRVSAGVRHLRIWRKIYDFGDKIFTLAQKCGAKDFDCSLSVVAVIS